MPTGNTFEGGEVEVYNMVKSVDYPRDPTTNEITAAIHPELQVQHGHLRNMHAHISFHLKRPELMSFQ